jgi:trigger factor
LPEWKGLKINRPVHEISSEDIDREIESVITPYGTLTPIDTPAEKGNFIEVNITTKLDGVVLDRHDNEAICIRKRLSFYDGFIDDFDKLTIGAKAGDVIQTKVNILDSAKTISARNCTVDVTIEVLGVKKLELPEMSPELLQQIGDYSDEADLRDAALDKLKSQIEFSRQSEVRQQISNALSDSVDWGDLPEEFLSRQSEREFKRAEFELIRSGFTQEKIVQQLNALRQNTYTAVTKALKEHFVLEKIAETEKITDTEEDYEQEINTLALKLGFSPRKLRAIIEKGGQIDILRNQIIERKIVQLISEHAVFTDTPFNFELFDIYAMTWSIAGGDYEINVASEEDLKAVRKEMEYKKKFEHNSR